MIEENIIKEMIEYLKICSDINKVKFMFSQKIGRVLKNYEILRYLKSIGKSEKELLEKLKSKKVRGASGIFTVAVMTKPSKCPKEEPCSYCPGGIKYGTPQSYIGKEPALMRAIQNNFDPYKQVMQRLLQYVNMGHTPSKIQLIIMGGTFPAMDLDYQEWFVTRCLEAMNDFPISKPYRWISLEEAQRRNEKSNVRCIGITMETRPDWAKEVHVDRMIRLGATLVEIGVQTLDDEILKRVKRGCTTKDVIEATRILRDSGLKVGYHMMPGLPGSNFDKDLEDLRRIFEDEDFKPDYLKIYPTLVIEGTELYKEWLEGKYKPMQTEDVINLLIKAHKYFPKWVRISRIQRDIPADIIVDGVKKSNLREEFERRLKEMGLKCKCIRCREIGLAKIRKEEIFDINPSIEVEEYNASKGVEFFISLEDKNKDYLIGFLRLRIPSEYAHRREVKNAGVIRELHVYGPQVPVGEKLEDAYQHKGYGTMLLNKAEEIVLNEFNLKKIVVLPGVGVRDYYRKRGYRKLPNSPYMMKKLS
ncbi:MAG: tRNA uridine(34) 5-carboxymethylaminomethyl modification radical SAM/GNAT enzyme Elp3 [Candidatus Verstraetearchaeota archaeon]|nr:tRNA uridine(34) 5-carboxymethylaminomethyl modification radical SAM/GNAT enzyme Elp3 [Candidatus Verstraetearchaeota archaeon]